MECSSKLGEEVFTDCCFRLCWCKFAQVEPREERKHFFHQWWQSIVEQICFRYTMATCLSPSLSLSYTSLLLRFLSLFCASLATICNLRYFSPLVVWVVKLFTTLPSCEMRCLFNMIVTKYVDRCSGQRMTTTKWRRRRHLHLQSSSRTNSQISRVTARNK